MHGAYLVTSYHQQRAKLRSNKTGIVTMFLALTSAPEVVRKRQNFVLKKINFVFKANTQLIDHSSMFALRED